MKRLGMAAVILAILSFGTASADERRRRHVPEFDATALGVIAAVVAGGGLVLARRRRR